jgi:hypothetical protein
MSEHNQLSKINYIWFRGVLGWGCTTAILWSLAMSFFKGGGSGFWDYLLISIFIFPIGGYFWGAWMWKRRCFTDSSTLSSNRENLFGRPDNSSNEQAIKLQNSESLTVYMKPARKLAWICIALFSSFSILSFFIGLYIIVLLHLAFAGLGVYLLLTSGSISINTQKIRLQNNIGCYEIFWDEVNYIETDSMRGALVFNGGNKRVAFPGPAWWAGPDKMAFISLLDAEIKNRSILTKKSQKALWRLSKNSKINSG